MCEELVGVASRTGGVGAWARVENAACARRLSATAEVLERALAADGSANREQWIIDNWEMVCAEVAAAQGVSPGVALHQVVIAMALRQRLPRVAEVFSAGQVSARVIDKIVYRTALIKDRDARATVDTEIAAVVAGWGSLSVAKVEQAIDYWVDRVDPDALVRTELTARGRHVDVVPAGDGSGLSYLQALLFGHDAQAVDQRLDAMARTVCDADPRTLEQRRSDALGALGAGADRLACACAVPDCPAAARTPSAVIVHVVAEEKSLSEDTTLHVDGAPPPGPRTDQLRQMTVTQALAPLPAIPPARSNPGVVMGGGLIPAPLLAATLAHSATIVPIVFPADTPPESRRFPSAVLATFIRCRDLTCRFPGCDVPAQVCDIDHTLPYPVGPTQAANLKCLCRKHRLHKRLRQAGSVSPMAHVPRRGRQGVATNTPESLRFGAVALKRSASAIANFGTAER